MHEMCRIIFRMTEIIHLCLLPEGENSLLACCSSDG